MCVCFGGGVQGVKPKPRTLPLPCQLSKTLCAAKYVLPSSDMVMVWCAAKNAFPALRVIID